MTTCYPTTITNPATGEILSFEYVDFDFNQGEVAVYVSMSCPAHLRPSVLAFEAALAWSFFLP